MENQKTEKLLKEVKWKESGKMSLADVVGIREV